MRKKFFVTSLFILFIFVCCLSSNNVYAANISNDIINNQIYLANLNNSLDTYSRILPQFKVGVDIFDDKEYIVYTENYAGAYIDDNGILNICLLDNNENLVCLSENNIIYQYFDYSYNYLQQILNCVESLMLTTSVYTVGIDEEINKVCVDLTNDEDISIIIQNLQNNQIYQENAISFDVDPNGYVEETATTAYGGESTLYRYSADSYSRGTLAVNAVSNSSGTLGMLTNAHVTLHYREMSYGGYFNSDDESFSMEQYMGPPSVAKQYGKIDAAFVPFKNQGEWEISPYAKYGSTIYDNVWLGNNDLIVRGQPITRIGQTTGITSAKIKRANASTFLNGEIIKNVFTFNNPPEGGDSGGPIYANRDGKLYLIGITFGRGIKWHNNNRGFACRISNVMEGLGVTPITNDSFRTTLLNDGTIQLDGLNFDISGEFNIPSSLMGKTVSKIASKAFSNMENLTLVRIPSSVCTIGNQAFENCTSLETIEVTNETSFTHIGTNVFSGCTSLNEITVTPHKTALYRNDSNWSIYSSLINPKVTSKYDFHCRTSDVSIDIDLQKTERIFYKLNIECPIQYRIKASAENKILMNIYKDDMSLLESGTPLELSGDSNIVYSYPLLAGGTYYVEIYFESNDDNGIINYEISPYTSTDDYISTKDEVDVITHLHNNKNEFIISPSESGLFLLELVAKVDGEYIEAIGDFVIKNSNGEIIQKLIFSKSNHPAESVNNSNNIMFYANQWGKYTVYLDVDDLDYQELTLKISKIEDFTIYDINEEDQYVGNINIPIGDSAYIYNLERIGTYDILFEYQGTQWQNMLFALFETDEQGEYSCKCTFDLNRNNNSFQYENRIEYSKKLILCVFDSNGNGNLSVKISKYLSNEFTIYGASSPTASTISLIKGYQEICYLGSDAPNPTSRYEYYNWYSTNENVILVSAYGTVTAVGVGEAQVKCVYKADPSITANLTIVVLDDPLDNGDYVNDIYLNYGFDVRIGGTISGTEVTGDKGSVIPISVNPYVSIHISYTRLICLGSDSPNSSVQSFNWTVYREGDDKGMVNVSQFGTVTGITSGWVTVEGTYKYNSRYKVKFKIYVENNI